MIQIHHGRIVCPTCKRAVDLGRGLGNSGGERVPKPGDVTVCAVCFELLRFTDPGSVSRISDEQLAAMPPRMQLGLRSARSLIMSARQLPGKN